MLIVKVFVNERQIDELHIHNISGLVENSTYRIKKPGVNNVVIEHQRSKGWMPLVEKVLKILIKKSNDG